MSDFLVSLNKRYTHLLNLIKKPYGSRAPEGQFFDYPWGSLAVLADRLADNRNIREREHVVFAWVGDLITEMSEEFVDALVGRIGQIKNCRVNGKISSDSSEIFGKLNGSFAILIADNEGFNVVTDPLSFVQVYEGTDGHNNLASVGTHSDLVASISDKSLHIDTVSVGEFLSSGTPVFPNTMYKNVRELEPGRLYTVRLRANKVEMKDFIYWSPPKEMRQFCDEHELSKELEGILLSVVRDRCGAERIGVFLSGGLDSRSIMAAVPQTVDCIGLTFCDYPNREVRTARRVAKCYHRDWLPLVRDKEFVGNTVVDVVRFIGCESECLYGRRIGCVDDMSKLDLSVVLAGAQFDVYLKGYFASDWFCEKRLRGLLPDRPKRKAYDYVNNISGFWNKNLKKEIVEHIRFRRKRTYEGSVDLSRGSIAEWMTVSPFSQDGHIAFWSASRRLLPVRLVAMDRRVLDFAFRCPIELKLGNRIFVMAAKNIYGAGSRIRNANDGVRPGSGHWWRLAQRAVRKLQDRSTAVLEKMGKEPRVQGSWIDYERYWRESSKLADLIREYGKNLDQFDGQIFEGRGLDLLKCKNINWSEGFRLLQLAVWKSVIEDYRL
jgi:hypothetical protein